jgi:glycosyltransferase involved in cell wall biosynthesis
VEQPLVSVIIPIYNAAAHLEAAIRSVKDQTYPAIELILVNDGSTDHSLRLARSYESEQVIVLNQENKGAAAARNLGLRRATGRFIQFLDADDLLSPDKIARQVDELVNYPGYLAVCDCIHFFSDGEAGQKPPENAGRFLGNSDDPVGFLVNLYGGGGPRGMVPLHSWLSPAYCIREAGNWNEALSVDDDGEYFCRVVLASKGIRYVKTVYSCYRKSAAGNTQSALCSAAAMRSLLEANRLKYQHLKRASTDYLVNVAMAGLFTEVAVIVYPEYPALYREAKKLVAETGIKGATVPVIGGKWMELLKSIFGWKAAKQLRRLIKNMRLG